MLEKPVQAIGATGGAGGSFTTLQAAIDGTPDDVVAGVVPQAGTGPGTLVIPAAVVGTFVGYYAVNSDATPSNGMVARYARVTAQVGQTLTLDAPLDFSAEATVDLILPARVWMNRDLAENPVATKNVELNGEDHQLLGSLDQTAGTLLFIRDVKIRDELIAEAKAAAPVQAGDKEVRGAVNLSFKDVSGEDLSGLDLEGATCSPGFVARGTDFTRAILRGANLHGAELDDAKLVDADCEGTNLCQACLCRSVGLAKSFRKANLSECCAGEGALLALTVKGDKAHGCMILTKAAHEAKKSYESRLAKKPAPWKGLLVVVDEDVFEGANLTKVEFDRHVERERPKPPPPPPPPPPPAAAAPATPPPAEREEPPAEPGVEGPTADPPFVIPILEDLSESAPDAIATSGGSASSTYIVRSGAFEDFTVLAADHGAASAIARLAAAERIGRGSVARVFLLTDAGVEVDSFQVEGV